MPLDSGSTPPDELELLSLDDPSYDDDSVAALLDGSTLDPLDEEPLPDEWLLLPDPPELDPLDDPEKSLLLGSTTLELGSTTLLLGSTVLLLGSTTLDDGSDEDGDELDGPLDESLEDPLDDPLEDQDELDDQELLELEDDESLLEPLDELEQLAQQQQPA